MAVPDEVFTRACLDRAAVEFYTNDGIRTLSVADAEVVLEGLAKSIAEAKTPRPAPRPLYLGPDYEVVNGQPFATCDDREEATVAGYAMDLLILEEVHSWIGRAIAFLKAEAKP